MFSLKLITFSLCQHTILSLTPLELHICNIFRRLIAEASLKSLKEEEILAYKARTVEHELKDNTKPMGGINIDKRRCGDMIEGTRDTSSAPSTFDSEAYLAVASGFKGEQEAQPNLPSIPNNSVSNTAKSDTASTSKSKEMVAKSAVASAENISRDANKITEPSNRHLSPYRSCPSKPTALPLRVPNLNFHSSDEFQALKTNSGHDSMVHTSTKTLMNVKQAHKTHFPLESRSYASNSCKMSPLDVKHQTLNTQNPTTRNVTNTRDRNPVNALLKSAEQKLDVPATEEYFNATDNNSSRNIAMNSSLLPEPTMTLQDVASSNTEKSNETDNQYIFLRQLLSKHSIFTPQLLRDIVIFVAKAYNSDHITFEKLLNIFPADASIRVAQNIFKSLREYVENLNNAHVETIDKSLLETNPAQTNQSSIVQVSCFACICCFDLKHNLV